MTRGWLSIALATALGACIGTLAALEISARFKYGSYFWGFGALLGGLTAYGAIDFKHFYAGVARGFHKSVDSFVAGYRKVANWKPNLLYWRATLVDTLGGFMVITSFVMLAVAMDYAVKPAGIYIGWFAQGLTRLAFLASCAMGGVFLFGIAISPYWNTRGSKERDFAYKRRMLKEIKVGWEIVYEGNPVVFPFILAKWTGSFLFSASKYLWLNGPNMAKTAWSVVWLAIKSVGKFFAYTFVYVHSQRRTICFVDATLGAAIGYSFGSAIVGAVAGAILGVINYELVSVRLLKLAPASR